MTAKGPGAGDDKGGMAVMVAALRAMQAAGTLKNADITVFLTGDEEDAGPGRDRAPRPDRGGQAGRRRARFRRAGPGRTASDMGSIARRSSDEWTLTVTAPQRPFERHLHARRRALARSTSWRGSSTRFRRELPEDKLTFNVGLIGGGATAELDAGRIRVTATGKTNIIAGTADRARRPARASAPSRSPAPRRRCRRSSRSRCPAPRPRSSSTPDGYPPMAPTAGNRALLDRLNAVNRDLGLPEMGELDPVKRGAGDISFVAADVDGLAGLGPASRGDHAPGRNGRHRQRSARQAKRAAILMSRLAAEQR